MTPKIAPNARDQYHRKQFAKAFYRVSGLERIQRDLAEDTDISPELRTELQRLVARRIDTLVESRLACVN
jgi:hypothetical protein